MSKGTVEFKKCDEYYTPKEVVDLFGSCIIKINGSGKWFRIGGKK